MKKHKETERERQVRAEREARDEEGASNPQIIAMALAYKNRVKRPRRTKRSYGMGK